MKIYFSKSKICLSKYILCGNLFLKTPDVFNLEYTHNGGEHKGLNRFKECALTNCVIDYTPSSGYANDVIGVDSSNILSVDGVATADISEINKL